ncbi:MAG: hypothetical protein KBD26_03495 [Candidatus Pacebacteria bacterium]|nr:hypothetical protein [Candidatus Paceibacterota bacterium]MBP9772869.1 hypothetical protein [Candidatus Paceibacterota bacterium]
MKLIFKIIFLMVVFIPFTSSAQRCLIDMDNLLTNMAQVKFDKIGVTTYAEILVNEIDADGDRGKPTLVFVDAKYLDLIKSLPTPVYVNVAIVKYKNGRFVQTGASDKNSARLICGFGNELIFPEFTPLEGEKGRSIGYFDLQYNIFYEVPFRRPGKDTVIWQSAMTLIDTSDRTGKVTQKMKLITLKSKEDIELFDTLLYAVRVEALNSVWSNEKNKFVVPSETPYTDDKNVNRLKLFGLSKTDRMTNLVIWSADIYTPPTVATQSDSDILFVSITVPSIQVEAISVGDNTVLLKWDSVGTDWSLYTITLIYPSGNTRKFPASDASIKLKNLPKGGTFKVFVEGPNGTGETTFEN